MTSHDSYEKRALRLFLAPVLLTGLAIGCAPAKSGGGGGSSDSSSSGSSSSGGSSSSKSSSSGGSSSGGSSSSSKSSSGGSSSGGSSSSSSSSSGGSSSGGSSSSSSSSAGGSSSGGSSGSSSAGGTGGSSASASAGSTASGDRPPGYFKTSDWGVSKVDWHGCVWAGSDNGKATSSKSSISPNDFTSGATTTYHVKGSTAADDEYESVGMLGFNITESPSGDAKQCVYKTPDPNAVGLPGVAMPTSTTKGIAINWSQGVGSQFRIQLNGPNGSKQGSAGASERWCATIKDAGGPSFVKWTDFYQSCWFVDTSGKDPGAQYKGEPIDAIVFTVPGLTKDQPFEFTINGFAPADDVKGVPGGTPTSCTPTSGTLGGSGTTDVDYARAKVKSSDCGTYIVQNNNWGNPSGSDQTLSYAGNSFKVTASSGTGSQAPASFPSVFQGRNGQVQNGAFSTEGTDNMPIQVSKIQSVNTTFTWSGGKSGGDYNAAYDVWFAASEPKAGSYNDAISGFVMVWFYDPPNHEPIGGGKKATATINGKGFDVWVGPRGGSGSNSNAPVVSYVAQSSMNDWTFDLNLFIKDAKAHGISDSWYLTDVFAGFEIWSGSDGVGLEAKKVSIAVK